MNFYNIFSKHLVTNHTIFLQNTIIWLEIVVKKTLNITR